VLILDDYHLVEGPPVHDSLTLLLERLPPGLRLVVASRTAAGKRRAFAAVRQLTP
jgi:LuxR family maltose regulon positive regulatory protein